jgi:probable F420-dependent oxidoreductase
MVNIGVGLPNGGSQVEPAGLVRLAVGAERLGLDSVWVVDRWLRPHQPVAMPGVPVKVTMPVDSYRSVFDPIEVLTFVAARTQRVLLGTSAINALYHPPVLLARRLATLDQLAGGRVIAGVTSGWMAEEFQAAGVPPERMGAGFDDHLAAMRQVWGPDPVSYQGVHYTIPTSDIGPKPHQPGGIPLVVGYNTAAGIRRAARIGDGLHPYRNDPGQLAADLALWRDSAAAAGRDPAGMPVVLRAAASLEGGADGERPLFTGDPDRWVDDLAQVAALGVDHVFVQFDPGVGVDTTLEILARVIARTSR